MKPSKKNTGLYWAIALPESNQLIGTICLFDFSDELKKCEIGYELLPQYQGQGVMKEALKKVIDFAFHTLKTEIIDAFTHHSNQNSILLLQKLNFKPIIVDKANANLLLYRLVNRS
jgi:[ribosomal protein S5]-alanine N-acetyltransferase